MILNKEANRTLLHSLLATVSLTLSIFQNFSHTFVMLSVPYKEPCPIKSRHFGWFFFHFRLQLKKWQQKCLICYFIQYHLELSLFHLSATTHAAEREVVKEPVKWELLLSSIAKGQTWAVFGELWIRVSLCAVIRISAKVVDRFLFDFIWNHKTL